MKERQREGEANPYVLIDIERAREVIGHALAARKAKRLIFSKELLPPEAAFMETIKEEGEKIGNSDFALNACFLMSVVIFADNSYRQLNRLANKEFFDKYGWILDPNKIKNATENEFLDAARTYTGAGYNAGALPGWRDNALLLVSKYEGKVRKFFASHNFEYSQILQNLVRPKKKKDWGGFRRFGPKISRLFLQWVSQYDLAELRGTSQLGIPVDFQVTRLMVQTGAVKLTGPTHKHWVQDRGLVEMIPKIISVFSEKPAYISETLWLIGSHCCNNYDHQACPLANDCNLLISRVPLDRDGLIDPQDKGRYLTKSPKRDLEKRKKQEEAGQKTLLLF